MRGAAAFFSSLGGLSKGVESIPTTGHLTAEPVERAYLVAVEIKGRDNSRWTSESSLEELAQLALTAGAEVVGRCVQRLARRTSAYYVGRGKVQELASLRDRLGYSTIIFDDELSPSQQRNLENALQIKVLDRTALILDIFA
ncbi:MAG: GTPase HflX, partial [Dehalococcoidia bacterium]|nr:GTPase HflX [Dehalococcoidia bacterium]